MNGELAAPEQEPTAGEIITQNREALERARRDPDLIGMADDLILTQEDEDFLFLGEDGEALDAGAAWEGVVGWWMQLGLDPTDYFEDGFIEKLQATE